MMLRVYIHRSIIIGESDGGKIVYVEDEEEMDDVYDKITSGAPDSEIDYEYEEPEPLIIEETVKACLDADLVVEGGWTESPRAGCTLVRYGDRDLTVATDFNKFTDYMEECGNEIAGELERTDKGSGDTRENGRDEQPE